MREGRMRESLIENQREAELLEKLLPKGQRKTEEVQEANF